MLTELNYLARTIYGEVRSENLETMVYIGWVIRNRVTGPPRFGSSYQEVVTKPFQFSSWNETDPNFPHILQPEGAVWKVCQGVAQAIYYATPKHNPIPGIYHYVDISVENNLPNWAQQGELIRFDQVPKIIFIKGVD